MVGARHDAYLSRLLWVLPCRCSLQRCPPLGTTAPQCCRCVGHAVLPKELVGQIAPKGWILCHSVWD